jgi:DeoR family transcriptional regulator, suf operon transcriptional repressor
MESNAPGLAGQKGLRGEILLAIKKRQPVAAKPLADSFGVSANAVRRHLLELEAGGLVTHDRVQRGNGAPTHSFRLSADGEALFPKGYEDALVRLLRYVVQKEGRSAAVAVMAEQYREYRRQVAPSDDLTPVDRLRSVAGVLQNAGYMAEIETNGDVPTLTIHNCAIRAAAECLPEVCDTELTFLQEVVNAPLERSAHMMTGCNVCEYSLKPTAGSAGTGATVRDSSE